ncbi:MAG: heavy metal translocating P-type ATPase [Clostridia bacterium]|nr:heavy metal translocating P-type ATPase [Clostridia bacterium]
MVKNYDITGMTCSACSSGIERAVGKLQGVNKVEVSLMGKCMRIECDESVLTDQAVFDCVTALGYGIYDEGTAPAEKEKSDDRKLFIRFIVSVCILVPLLYVSMGHMVYLPLPFFLDPAKGYAQWFALYQLILSAAVIGVNYKFFTRGFVALIKRVPNMDTLVALGSGVSFIYSLVLTVLIFIGAYNGNGEWYAQHMNLYFESAATILTLVTVGKWLEEKSKRKTGDEIEKLLRLAPDTVTVEVDGERKTVPVRSVKAGDICVVMQGDYVPVDGVIVEGHSFVDKSAITGESMPVEVSEGDRVTTASVNSGGVIKVRAEKVGGQTTLAQIIKMVRQAGASKAPIQKFADKVAGVFVPVVTAISLITFAVWLLIDGGFNPSHSVTYAISVLVVSCPCALGLATPVAIMTATGKAASLGVLYKDADALQKTRDLNCILLDKTATITEGKPQVSDFIAFDFDESRAQKIAGGIESNSNHPLAKCIAEYCGSGDQTENFEYVIGKGTKAQAAGVNYRLGNRALLDGIKISSEVSDIADTLSAQGKTVMYLSDESRVIAIIAVVDAVKQTSAEAVKLLKNRGIKLAMLTGDGKVAASAVAASVGIDDYMSEVMPEDKLKAVENMQNAGGVVAMVGDGINDSPALKKADVGVAIGDGTDVAIDSAGVVLVGGDLRALDTAIDLSRATVRNIKQNLFWAFFYNAVMIPLAAGVLSPIGVHFNPMWAALAMSLSSLFVVGNALRLLRYKNKNLKVKAPTENSDNNQAENSDINQNENNLEEDNYMKKLVSIEGMCCQHCADRVEKALSTVSGVVSADVKLKKNLAVIRSREEVSDEEIKKVVEDAGYKVTAIESK